MKTISIIVAIAEKNAIGIDNKLLCHLPEDLKRFKRITSGNTVIMGRNTFLSLPAGALPHRTNIVISDNPADRFENCIMAHSIDDAIAKCPEHNECFVIGGGSVYKQFLPLASRLYLTQIHHSFEADTYFPEINFDDWELGSKDDFPANDKCSYSYSYLVYERKEL